MKTLKFICSILFLIVVVSSCTKIEGVDKDLSFLTTVASTNPSQIFDVSTDNSGDVKITPLGNGVVSYTVNYGHGSGAAASAVVAPGLSTSHSYPEGDYTVGITATDIAGVTTTTTYPLKVTYRAPEDVTITVDADVVVSAKAKYAKSFEVSFGDTAGKVYPLAIGAKLPSHTYAAGGPYNLKVVALSGGAAKTEVVRTMFGLPLTFDNATMVYNFGTFGTGQGFETVANPSATGLNTSAKVGKFIRGSEGWSGTFSPLDIPINFAQGKIIKLLVYNPDPAMVGKKLNVELESAVGGKPANGIAVKKATVTKSGEWEELVLDFSTITEIKTTTKFNQLVLRFNATAVIPGTIIYVDDIRFTN